MSHFLHRCSSSRTLRATAALAAATLGALLCSATSAHAQLVNGGFENTTVPSGTYQTYAPGQTIGASGWVVTGSAGNNVILIQTNYTEAQFGLVFNAQEGNNTLDLTGVGNTGAADGVQQVIATTNGATYAVSFYVGRAQGDPNSPYLTPATVDFSVNGGARVSFTNSNSTAGAINFQQFTTLFTATSSSTTLAFLNGTPQGNNYAGLDSVTIRQLAVPEPGSIALLVGTGVWGAGLFIRRRKHAER